MSCPVNTNTVNSAASVADSGQILKHIKYIIRELYIYSLDSLQFSVILSYNLSHSRTYLLNKRKLLEFCFV
jgi:hypothetical protein